MQTRLKIVLQAIVGSSQTKLKMNLTQQYTWISAYPYGTNS